jgi:hypothetical protein
MTYNLTQAIEGLYLTFSVYPFNSGMEGCPCCVSNADKEKIHSKPLEKLESDDLSRYAFKALTTWGDVDDFKHYLPRIFELLSTTNFIVDTFVVLGKLSYGQWRTWEPSEQNSIETFLYAWWEDLIQTRDFYDTQPFFEILKLTNNNIDKLLELWQIDVHHRSFRNYVDFIFDQYYNLVNTRGDFKNMDLSTCEKLKVWIRKNSPTLEAGYFYFESTDQEFAAKISDALYVLERMDTNI